MRSRANEELQIPPDFESLGRRVAIHAAAGRWEQAEEVLRRARVDAALARPGPARNVHELFDCRLANALERAGYERVDELARASREDLLAIRGIGERQVATIISQLEAHGIRHRITPRCEQVAKICANAANRARAGLTSTPSGPKMRA